MKTEKGSTMSNNCASDGLNDLDKEEKAAVNAIRFQQCKPMLNCSK
jgi:hypothetical protein